MHGLSIGIKKLAAMSAKEHVPVLCWVVTEANRARVVSRSTAAHRHVAACSMARPLRSRRCHHCCNRQACLCQRSRRGSCAARRSSMPSAGVHGCGLAAPKSTECVSMIQELE